MQVERQRPLDWEGAEHITKVGVVGLMTRTYPAETTICVVCNEDTVFGVHR